MVIDPSKSVEIRTRVAEGSSLPTGRDSSTTSEQTESRRDQVQFSDEARALAAEESANQAAEIRDRVGEVQARLQEAFYDDLQIAQETVRKILSAGVL
jgi:hypothetical protein